MAKTAVGGGGGGKEEEGEEEEVGREGGGVRNTKQWSDKKTRDVIVDFVRSMSPIMSDLRSYQCFRRSVASFTIEFSCSLTVRNKSKKSAHLLGLGLNLLFYESRKAFRQPLFAPVLRANQQTEPSV